MNVIIVMSTKRWWIVVTEKGPKVQRWERVIVRYSCKIWWKVFVLRAEWNFKKYLLLIIKEKDSIFVSCYFFKQTRSGERSDR